jgi:hypothetical protein
VLPKDPGQQSLALRFREAADEFAACPLYRTLCLVVADDERLLEIAAQRRPGQQPANLLFAAVHRLLLDDPTDELARWYPSIDGSAARPPETAGEAFASFCLHRRDALVALLSERLVQTNVVKRATALRLGLAHVSGRTAAPLTLIEVGASAGVLLAFDRFRYRVGGRSWGTDSPVEITSEWRGTAASLPDLDRLPPISRRFGIDLSPVDPTDAKGRAWLRALVWPGNEAQWALLERALDLISENPPRVMAGDAIELLGSPPSLELAPGQTVVVFHAATRAHIPTDRRAAFDKAIRDLGRERRIFRLSQEGSPEPLPEVGGLPGHLLELTDVDGEREEARRLAFFDGHAEWAVPLPETASAAE